MVAVRLEARAEFQDAAADLVHLTTQRSEGGGEWEGHSEPLPSGYALEIDMARGERGPEGLLQLTAVDSSAPGDEERIVVDIDFDVELVVPSEGDADDGALVGIEVANDVTEPQTHVSGSGERVEADSPQDAEEDIVAVLSQGSPELTLQDGIVETGCAPDEPAHVIEGGRVDPIEHHLVFERFLDSGWTDPYKPKFERVSEVV